MLRPRPGSPREVRHFINTADTFDIFAVMLAKHPTILNDQMLPGGAARLHRGAGLAAIGGFGRYNVDMAHRFHPFCLREAV